MARGRLKIKRLILEATRRSNLKLRAGLIEQASQLSMVCGLTAGKVVHGPGGAQPEEWPSVEDAIDLVELFSNLPASDKTEHMLNLEHLLQLVVDIAQKKEKLLKARCENQEREVSIVLHDYFSGRRKNFDDLSPELASAVYLAVGTRIQAISQRIQTLRAGTTAPALPRQADPVAGEPLAQVTTVAPPPAADAGVDVNAPTAMDAPSPSGQPPKGDD